MTRKRAGEHARNLGPMMAAARCGAQTRRGTACRAPAVAGKRRCRMHGGARGSGAPQGNRNALKHGLYTRDNLELMREMAALLRESRRTLRDIS